MDTLQVAGPYYKFREYVVKHEIKFLIHHLIHGEPDREVIQPTFDFLEMTLVKYTCKCGRVWHKVQETELDRTKKHYWEV